MIGLTFRSLSNSDHRRLSEFAAWMQSHGQISDAFFWPPELLIAEFYSGSGVGAFDEDLLVGYVLWRELPGVREISSLATLPDYRGRGVMRHLLEMTCDGVRNDGEVWLEVHELNLNAQKLYKNSGFIQTGKRPRYYRDGAAALLYAWKAAVRD